MFSLSLPLPIADVVAVVVAVVIAVSFFHPMEIFLVFPPDGKSPDTILIRVFSSRENTVPIFLYGRNLETGPESGLESGPESGLESGLEEGGGRLAPPLPY